MRSKPLIAGVLAGSLLTSGCANTDGGDAAGALLLGAAVIGLGVLAATTLSDDDDGDRRSHRHRDDYRDSYRYANNGRCDDPSYRTSNGGRAAPGTDERDCRRHGDGRK
ncbi:hypothetical protein [Azospirillum sp. TSO22-1]|uniref:hypothetical protein n=1 Tax=Azospirillum sp. TSO22-1 TaxID=716789 RepID=UPI000D65B75F|nr:hypothetical protein [Azospirillum sp. TSO22-1]